MLKTKATEAFWTSFRNQANEAPGENSPESAGIKFCNGLPDSTSPATRNPRALQWRRAGSCWTMVQKFSSHWLVQAERHVRSKRNHDVLPSLLSWVCAAMRTDEPPRPALGHRSLRVLLWRFIRLILVKRLSNLGNAKSPNDLPMNYWDVRI